MAEQWRLHGFVVILVIAADGLSHLDLKRQDLPQDVGVLLRRNAGYDFGSWAYALRICDDLRLASLLALANDSVFGPMSGFDRVLDKVNASSGDVIGMTDSHEVAHHIQSYLIFYKPKALSSDAFRRFWTGRRNGDRETVIFNSEVPLMSAMQRGGLATDVLFPTVAKQPLNPTLLRWRDLLEAGFPFLKVQVMRDRAGYVDVAGWDQLLRDRGFDPELVCRHLGSGYPGSAAEAGASVAFKAGMRP